MTKSIFTCPSFFSFRQRQQVLGNKIETEITQTIEQNPTILRVGLHFEYNDARNRVATHLQRNLDRSKCDVRPTLLYRLKIQGIDPMLKYYVYEIYGLDYTVDYLLL